MFLFSINPILIFSAIVPAIFLMSKVYKSDRLDKEPVSLLVSLAVLGVISTSIALTLEKLGGMLIGIFCRENSMTYLAVENFIVVGLSEEFSKYILLKKKTWFNLNFNCQFDGVVYAVFVSLGFALWENIGYVVMYGLTNALVRAVTAVPGHACFGVFMGTLYGAAKKCEYMGDYQKSKSMRKKAVIIPMLMHGTYDFLASLGSSKISFAFTVFIIIMFYVSYKMVQIESNNDQFLND